MRAAGNFEGTAWVTFDMCYRRRAARRKDLAWSRVDPELYQDAFTGRARAVPRCSYCLSPHHASPICPFAPPPFVTSSPFVASAPNGAGSAAVTSGTPQICGLYNKASGNSCRYKNCRFAHNCRECVTRGRGSQGHPASSCPFANRRGDGLEARRF